RDGGGSRPNHACTAPRHRVWCGAKNDPPPPAPAPPTTTGRPPATPDRPTSAAGKIGVLLVNLGTPEAADAAAVRRYLKEFLTDARVIEDQGALWQLVLNGIILPVRPRR